MDRKALAEGAPYHLGTERVHTQLWRFWVVTLDCGLEIYQIPDDPNLKEGSPWLRLKQFCADNKVKPIGMRFQKCDNNPVALIILDAEQTAQGYFYTKRIGKIMAADPIFNGMQFESQGFGELHDNKLHITWVNTDEVGNVSIEVRDLSKLPELPLGLLKK